MAAAAALGGCAGDIGDPTPDIGPDSGPAWLADEPSPFAMVAQPVLSITVKDVSGVGMYDARVTVQLDDAGFGGTVATAYTDFAGQATLTVPAPAAVRFVQVTVDKPMHDAARARIALPATSAELTLLPRISIDPLHN